MALLLLMQPPVVLPVLPVLRLPTMSLVLTAFGSANLIMIGSRSGGLLPGRIAALLIEGVVTVLP